MLAAENKFRQRGVAAAVACAVFAASCVTTNPDGTHTLDDKTKAALVGAAAGCGVAAATGHNCVKGAVVGAIAAYLVSWYFESRKVADAKQINKEYAAKRIDGKKYRVPDKEIKPAAFKSDVATAPPAANGEREVTITSNTDLVGYGDKVPVMQQKYAIYDENDKLIETKTEKIAAVDGAGRYQTSAKFKTHGGAKDKDKKYRVETTLLANDKEVGKNNYSISFDDRGRGVMVALR